MDFVLTEFIVFALIAVVLKPGFVKRVRKLSQLLVNVRVSTSSQGIVDILKLFYLSSVLNDLSFVFLFRSSEVDVVLFKVSILSR